MLVGLLWFKLNRFERVNANLDDKPPDGPVNFLMVGSDSRENITADDPDADAFLGDEVSGQRTDTIMVVRVDAAANSISILSVPRDLWVPIAGVGEDRINTAFAVGGAQLLIDTVRSVLRSTSTTTWRSTSGASTSWCRPSAACPCTSTRRCRTRTRPVHPHRRLRDPQRRPGPGLRPLTPPPVPGRRW